MAKQTVTTRKKPTTTAKQTHSQRLSLWFFRRPRKTALIWLVIALFGAASYGTLLKREGFPSVATPFAIAKGSYLVHDPARVDREVGKPLSNFLTKQEGVKSVLTQSFSDFYTTIVNYEEGVNSGAASKTISKKLAKQGLLPTQATFQLEPYEFGFTERGDDLAISFYSQDGQASIEELVAQGQQAAAFIQKRNLPLVQDVSVLNPLEPATNPLTGQTELNQKSFDRYGQRQGGDNKFYTSVVIGVLAENGADNLELDQQVRSAVTAYNKQAPDGFRAEISASYAPQIREQINELQTALLVGLLAVLVVGSIVIAVRASVITVLSMVTVIALVNGLLYLIGYSLNTITLFALILGLSLIVDDTIIMVEALDKQRRRKVSPDQAVEQATGKVGRAMLAATSTSVLSFAPLLFVGGVLGGFIRAIPITIISALIISLLVALIIIPLLARYLLLGKKQVGKENVHEAAAGVEAAIARFISGPMLWAKGSTKKLLLVGLTAVFIGFGFIGAGGYLFQKVTFNIFPPAKDSNQLATTITFGPGTDITEAQAIVDRVDDRLGQELGSFFKQATYYGQGNIQSSLLVIDITDYKERDGDHTAPKLIKQLNAEFVDFKAAKVEVASLDVGPPAPAFTIQVDSSQDRDKALKLAGDIAAYLRDDAKLERIDGSVAKLKTVDVGNSSIYNREDGKSYVSVEVKFVDTDTSALVTLAQDAVEKEFTADKVKSYDLKGDAISFNSGQEEENMDSFKTLAIAFPVLLLAIYVVLAFEFRSLLQPILIFTALPFSLFGITLGLYLTDNAFSFFAMLGFFALIGLSIKNTILLTDYANQARRAGMGTVDSAHEALAERFRPLIATSLTAMVSLIPLALSSPFWEGLAVVLIFGLLSSTFLVITVFPYYYLGAEYLRQHVNRRTGLTWLLMTVIISNIFANTTPKLGITAPLIAAVTVYALKRYTPLKLR